MRTCAPSHELLARHGLALQYFSTSYACCWNRAYCPHNAQTLPLSLPLMPHRPFPLPTPPQDAALDALQEELEAAILRPGAGLVADWGALVCGLCCRPDLLAADVALAAAALGSLSKLMALDAGYCEANCSIFFTRLTGRG